MQLRAVPIKCTSAVRDQPRTNTFHHPEKLLHHEDDDEEGEGEEGEGEKAAS